jgi:murein DD-endopeptidase MepM/ murein hydrolase activator NlpD
VAVLGLCGVAAFGLAPDTTLDTVARREITRELALPALEPVGEDGPQRYWREERIQRGDTLGGVFARLGVDDPAAIGFLHRDPAARALYQLRPGRPLRVEMDDEGRLLRLRLSTGGGELLTIDRDGDRFSVQTQAPAADVRWRMASGEIRSSLFGAADAAGLPDAVTLQLAEVFAGDIDFYKDLRRGDRFAVVYEVRYVDGEVHGTGRIVAALFVNAGKAYRAFLWRGADGSDGYYSVDGVPLRKTFLRSPMEFSRITSGFSNARFHPILHETRAHRGTDYAAPVGTPVRATGSGRVDFAGVRRGYGNVIELQHHGPYSTVYAHLSGFAQSVKPGARVSQGEVIGYVGQTGWATGPHLHYEFRIGGEQRDPQTVALPSSEPLHGADRAAFVAGIHPAAEQIRLAQALAGVRLAGGE